MLNRCTRRLFDFGKCIIKQSTYYYSKHITKEERIRQLRMSLPKTRENPMIIKLESPEFKSLFTEELTSLVSLFETYGYEIRIVGGAVRDLLMGKKPSDLDFATTATPTEMKDMFTKENIRMINMNGEKHGTITTRINDKENFEVTTLRIDVVTDGRHAKVEFTTDWLLDALRRDLTINSMYLGLDGSVYDYFYGYDDLKSKRVAFVGDAVTRIQEDYLRILRYFRFYGRIAEFPNKHEEDTLKAIRENAAGLANISGERIWTELKKILEGNFAGELLQSIIDCGLSPYIGLPQECNENELSKVWERSKELNLHPITLLSTVLANQDHVVALNNRLKLSAFERELALFVVNNREEKPDPKPLKPYQKLLLTTKSKQSDVKLWIIEVLKYNNSSYIEEFEKWQVPKFPITGNMLKKHITKPKVMGTIINELKLHWFEKDFVPDSEELMKELPNIMEKFNIK